MLATSRRTVVAHASAQQKPSPAAAFRKRVEAKRTNILKENFSKLATIATADSAFLNETFKELDTMHREFFDKAFAKKKEDEVADNEKGDSENIFLEERSVD